MKVDSLDNVLIEGLTEDGCGLSADGKLLVYGALPGETVAVQPITRKKKRTYCRATSVRAPSPQRVEPHCSAATVCGGCCFQHLHHEQQIALKTNLLRDRLGRNQPEEWLPALTAAEYQYRSKARLGVRFVEKKNRVLVGFREKHKPYIADVESCPVLRAPVDELIEPLSKLVTGLSNPRGIPQIEVAAGDDSVALVFRHLDSLTEDDHELLKRFGSRHDVWIYLQPGGIESTGKLYPDTDELLRYELREFDLKFDFHPHDFTQVNLAINRLMVSRAVELLELSKSDAVLDAFCGIGNFSLAIARRAGRVIGIEQSEASLVRARDNAVLNRLTNAEFQACDLYAEPLQLPEIEASRKVLLDPPRSGALQLVKKLASLAVERVVYVSCNPETLARDVNYLVSEAGFQLRSVGIIDMFPHTTHVESVALIVR